MKDMGRRVIEKETRARLFFFFLAEVGVELFVVLRMDSHYQQADSVIDK